MTFPALFILAAALSAGNAEFEKASVETAADIALGRLEASLIAEGIPADALKAAMLAAPADYHSRAEAERKCRTFYRAQLAADYARKASGILNRLNARRPAPPPPEKVLQAATDKHFGAAFNAARTAACAEQARQIAVRVKPDEAEFETMDDATARARLTDRIVQAKGLHVFEENRKYIADQVVAPLLEDARRERRRQQEYLARTRCDAYAPSALAAGLEANLRKNVAERRAQCADPERAWNVFPRMLAETLPATVKHRLVARMARAVENVPFALDTNAVTQIIRANPQAHHTAAGSEKIFRQQFAHKVISQALEAASHEAPANERAEFRDYMAENLKANELVRAAESRVRRDVLPAWRPLRKAIAQKEAETLWPTLLDSTWYPGAELADRMAARSDYDEAVKAWRMLPEMAATARGTGSTAGALEESGAAADDAAARAFNLARKAIMAQKNLLADIHPTVLQDARERKNSFFTRTPDLAAITEMLTTALERQWQEKRLQLLWGRSRRPANAAEQHTEIFPSVRREIELLAHLILEEMKKPEDAEPTPPKETPPEDEEPNDVCIISFEVRNGRVTVRAKRGQEVIAERSAAATVRGFNEAVQEVGAVVGRKVLKLR